MITHKLKIIFLFFMISLHCYSQMESKNYYFPSHLSIPDSIRTLSKYSFYLSGGVGLGITNYGGGLGLNTSFSFAYKSHILSVSRCGVLSNIYGVELHPDDDWFYSSYKGGLIGESYRNKYFIVSLSAGLAYSNVSLHATKNKIYYYRDGISVPIELKAYGLLYDGIGIGFFSSFNITPQHSTLFTYISIVIGHWNRWKLFMKK